MNSEERIEAIRSFGYTEREARFLELVALHSGYFLRRQYNQFLGLKRGGTTAALIRKLLMKRQVEVEPSCNRTPIYHLKRHSFYDLIGEPNNRNRRRRGTVGVKTKLMGLDLVLDRPDDQWLGTEREKISFFVDTALVPEPLLPAKTHHTKGSRGLTARYFVEKFPIWVSADVPSLIPVVSFAYIDPGPSRTTGFATFLRRHSLLLASLARARAVYVSDSTACFGAAERTFREFEKEILLRGTEGVEARLERFIRFLELESAARAKQWKGFTKQTLDELRGLRGLFDVPENQAWLTLWSDGGASYVRQSLTALGACRNSELRFETLRLTHDYQLLGTL